MLWGSNCTVLRIPYPAYYHVRHVPVEHQPYCVFRIRIPYGAACEQCSVLRIAYPYSAHRHLPPWTMNCIPYSVSAFCLSAPWAALWEVNRTPYSVSAFCVSALWEVNRTPYYASVFRISPLVFARKTRISFGARIAVLARITSY